MKLNNNCSDWVEEKLEVNTFLSKLKLMLSNKRSIIKFEIKRTSDRYREERYTNRYTIADLFPNENPLDALRRELGKLVIGDYVTTARDLNNPKYPNYYVFGKKYKEFVYIKIKIVSFFNSELVGSDFILVMSFHYAEYPMTDNKFPYK